jgi:hypothetical protein
MATKKKAAKKVAAKKPVSKKSVTKKTAAKKPSSKKGAAKSAPINRKAGAPRPTRPTRKLVKAEAKKAKGAARAKAQSSTAFRVLAAETAAAKNTPLTQAEILELKALPAKFGEAPGESIQDAEQNARNAQAAFYQYETELLDKTKLTRDVGEKVGEALLLFQRAERAWQKTRSNVPSLVVAREEGKALKSSMLSGLRYFLRDNSAVQGRCDAIVEGSGDVDTGDDLAKLADLYEEFPRELAKADVPKKAIARARELSDVLVGGATDRKVNPVQAEAIALRNRAYAALQVPVDQIFEAGRYLFRDQPKHAKAFRRIEHYAKPKKIV